jgi:8-oxo-dGTP pyrophosphatase MutT (NUDIX family)
VSDRHAFEVVSTEDIHQGSVFALRSDKVRMPGGREARREVVEHFGAVAVVALDDQHRLVLIHQYRHPLGRRLWEFPAGLLDEAGEDPVRTAERELAEEAGFAARSWSVLVDVASSPGMTDEVVRVFLAQELSEVNHSDTLGTGEDNEESDIVVRRVPVDEAVRMVFAGEILNAPTVSGVLAVHAVLGGHATLREPDAPWPDRPRRFAARRASG